MCSHTNCSGTGPCPQWCSGHALWVTSIANVLQYGKETAGCRGYPPLCHVCLLSLYLYPTSPAEQFTMFEQSAWALCLYCLSLAKQSRSDATSSRKLSLSSTLQLMGRISFGFVYILLMALTSLYLYYSIGNGYIPHTSSPNGELHAASRLVPTGCCISYMICCHFLVQRHPKNVEYNCLKTNQSLEKDILSDVSKMEKHCEEIIRCCIKG